MGNSFRWMAAAEAATKRSVGRCHRGGGATNVEDDAPVGRRLEVGAAEKPGRARVRCVGGTEIAAVAASASGRRFGGDADGFRNQRSPLYNSELE